MKDICWIEKDSEEAGRDLICILRRNIPGEAEENYKE